MIPLHKRKAEIYLQRIRSLHKNTYVYFGLAGAIIVGTLLFHSYPLSQDIKEYKKNIKETEIEIGQKEQKKAELQKELEEVTYEYEIVIEEWKPILNKVWPIKNPTDQIVRFIEEFSLASDTKSHPIKIENISFSDPREEATYSVLPFRMSVETDEYNFILFLERIKRSGSLKKADFYKLEPVPIMSVESINVNLPEEKIGDETISLGSEDEEVETFVFTVEMAAYFREEVLESEEGSL